MKKSKFVITALIALLSSAASAQSDFTISWSVGGLSLGVTSFQYDLNLGSRYIGANGSYTFSSGLSVPSTGTCFETSNGVLCNVTMNAFTASLDIGSNLNGVVTILGPNGETLERGTLSISSVE